MYGPRLQCRVHIVVHLRRRVTLAVVVVVRLVLYPSLGVWRGLLFGLDNVLETALDDHLAIPVLGILLDGVSDGRLKTASGQEPRDSGSRIVLDAHQFPPEVEAQAGTVELLGMANLFSATHKQRQTFVIVSFQHSHSHTHPL